MKLPLCMMAGMALLAAAALPASAAIERTVQRSFAAPEAGTLFVNTHGGSIRVMPSSAGEVTVTARQRIRANTDREADEILKKLEMTIEQRGRDVHAAAKYEGKAKWFFGTWPPVQVDFVVTVPSAFAVELNTAGGGVTVGDLAGEVKARTSGGQIELGKLGGSVHARTSGGNVRLDAANGAVELSTSGGNITVGHVKSRAKLSTSGGNIRIDSVGGGLRAHTSGGSIRAAIGGALTEDSSLSTSGGSVSVAVAKTAAFRLDAASTGGGVDEDGLSLSLSSSKTRTRLVGDVNGGGPELKLRTTGGSVTVRAGE